MSDTTYFFSDSVDSNAYLSRKHNGLYSIVISNQFNNTKYSMELSNRDLLNFVAFIQQFLQDQQ